MRELCRSWVSFVAQCGQAPDHSTIARFRQHNQELVVRLAAEVSQLSAAAGLATYEVGQGRLFAIDEPQVISSMR